MGLLQMSFSGAVFILAVIVIRALTIHKLPKKTFSALWKIVILRLLLPFSVPSIFSIYTFAGSLFPVSGGTAQHLISSSIKEADVGKPVSEVLAGQPENLGIIIPAQQEGISAWQAVWCIGMAACAAFFLFSYFSCLRDFRSSLPVRNDFTEQWQKEHRQKRQIAIRQSNQISSPLTYGILRPVVLMPKKTNWEDTRMLEYVLAHEYAHIRRLDAVTKLAFLLALCIHWFNPMVWVMYLLLNRDIELACDEEVVSCFGESARSSYALTLIGMEEKKNGLVLLYNNFSKNSVEERIRSIMKYKKISKLTFALAVTIVIGATAAFATSPAKADDEGNTGNEYNMEDMGNAENIGDTAGDKAGIAMKKREIAAEKSYEVSLAPGEEIVLGTIRVEQGQAVVITKTCEGVQWIGLKLEGERSHSCEARVEKAGVYSVACMEAEGEDYLLTVYNPKDSDIKATIGYAVVDGGELNGQEAWDLMHALIK